MWIIISMLFLDFLLVIIFGTIYEETFTRLDDKFTKRQNKLRRSLFLIITLICCISVTLAFKYYYKLEMLSLLLLCI